MTDETKNDIDLLRHNYLEMNETGKKKMKKVYEKILEIHKITTGAEKLRLKAQGRLPSKGGDI